MRATGVPREGVAHPAIEPRFGGRRRRHASGLAGRTAAAALGGALAMGASLDLGGPLDAAGRPSFGIGPTPAAAQSLAGGRSVMRRQFNMGIRYDYTPLRNAAHVRRFVELGLLVHLPGNANYRLHLVDFPYARPEVKLFVERLSAQYRRGCGEQLVVTSLTRPLNRQPANSSSLSVHPRGMAVDIRSMVPRACRAWLEDVLLYLEGRGVLDVTRERRPPHYHVAVFTREYASYVATLETQAGQRAHTNVAQVAAQSSTRYRVRQGDSLWGIARTYGTTVDHLISTNNLRSSRIYEGQTLRVTRAADPG